MVIKSRPFALMGVHVHPVLPPGYGPGVDRQMDSLAD